MMKKLLAMLLCAATLGLSLAACGGNTGSDTPSGEGTTAAGNSAEPAAETTNAPETTDLSAYDYLEKADYDGYEFRIIGPSGQTRYLPVTAVPEELTGEIIYDNAFERNKAVEEAFNVSIVYVDGVNTSTATTMITSSVLAGDDAIDMAINSLSQMGTMASQGMFLDVNAQDNIHTDMPWYNQKVNANLTFNGKLKTFASDFTCIFLSCTYCVFFNHDMAADFKLPDLYQEVMDGVWTIDKLISYSTGVAADIDGDGKMTTNDRFGFCSYASALTEKNEVMSAMQYGMGQTTTTPGADGTPVLTLNNERTVKITDYLMTLFRSPDSMGLIADNSNITLLTFAASRALFLGCIIMHAPNYMRDMEDTYGILTMPKFDEAQEEYYTNVSPGSAMFEAIPITVADADKITAIFEALAYEGHERVIPAFFETSMKVKYSHDANTTKILDMLRESTVVDFGMVFDGGVGMLTLVAKTVAGGTNNFASNYAAIEEKALAQYETVLASFQE